MGLGCTWIGGAELSQRLADNDSASDSACPDCARQIAEELPDRTVAPMEPGTSTLDHGATISQEVGVLSEIGLVDEVSGTIAFNSGSTGWEDGNDADAYRFEVAESCNLSLVGDWTDQAADLDFGVWQEDESAGWVDLFSQYGPNNCLGSEKPSACQSAVSLEPDTEYLLLVLGYLGSGDEPYAVSLEWRAP